MYALQVQEEGTTVGKHDPFTLSMGQKEDCPPNEDSSSLRSLISLIKTRLEVTIMIPKLNGLITTLA